ncbi:MAG: acyl-CoA/acyl-ACP dehydrogenase [Rubrobacter sp.]|nr:acyl-CoA/acyl-ACP dehydrogenase [Rubrobacter sp.]
MNISSLDNREGSRESSRALEAALATISAGAGERDANPSFPEEPFRRLAPAGVLEIAVPDHVREHGRRASFTEEWHVLRAVAGADGSVGRILDGHFNGVERLSLLAPEPLRSTELEAVAAGELLLGVWGADPIPGEGEPARLVKGSEGSTLAGVKTFCSGSTGVDRALVLVRSDSPGPPHLVYVDLSTGVEVDTGWFKGAGMRASESHRVVFDGAPVLAVLGEPGELLREPYFSRDAVRTAVTWAGISDSAVDAALDVLVAKADAGEPDDVVSLAAGRMLTARGIIDCWLEYAAARADADPSSLPRFATQLRQGIAQACREILDEAARAVGSHPFAVSGPLDRARRDLELFLLQHRLEPALIRRGRQAITQRRS